MSRTILVVEDDPEERQIFTTYLEFVGGRMLSATNGAEGLRLAREEQPEAILLDLSMPVLDGWEMIRRLQEDRSTAQIPVIAVTGHHLPREKLEAAGFCGYLEKPLAPYRILEEVERCLGPVNTEGTAADRRDEKPAKTATQAVWANLARTPDASPRGTLRSR